MNSSISTGNVQSERKSRSKNNDHKAVNHLQREAEEIESSPFPTRQRFLSRVCHHFVLWITCHFGQSGNNWNSNSVKSNCISSHSINSNRLRQERQACNYSDAVSTYSHSPLLPIVKRCKISPDSSNQDKIPSSHRKPPLPPSALIRKRQLLQRQNALAVVSTPLNHINWINHKEDFGPPFQHGLARSFSFPRIHETSRPLIIPGKYLKTKEITQANQVNCVTPDIVQRPSTAIAASSNEKSSEETKINCSELSDRRAASGDELIVEKELKESSPTEITETKYLHDSAASSNCQAIEVEVNQEKSDSTNEILEALEAIESLGKSTSFYIPLSGTIPTKMCPKFPLFTTTFNRSVLDEKHTKFKARRKQRLKSQLEMRQLRRLSWTRRREKGLKIKWMLEHERSQEEGKTSLRASKSRPHLRKLNFAEMSTSAICLVKSQTTIVKKKKSPRKAIKELLSSIHLANMLTVDVDAYCSRIKQLAKASPSNFAENVPELVRILLEQIKNLKPRVCGPAIKILRRLYDIVPKYLEAECQTIVSVMLDKLSGPLFIASDIADILSQVVIHNKALRVCHVLEKVGVNHRTSIGRSISAKLMSDTVKRFKENWTQYIGLNVDNQSIDQKKLSKYIFDIAVRFVSDQNFVTRDAGRDIWTTLFTHPNFFDFYMKYVKDEIRAYRINQVLDELRCIKRTR